jgi:hypothetical protein
LEIVRKTQERYVEAFILNELGHTHRALNQIDAAVDAFGESIQLHQDLGQSRGRLAPLAGLARTHLDAGDLAFALNIVDEILEDLAAGDLYNIERPLRVYLTCYQVLQAHQDPRAKDILASAHTLLQQLVGKLEEEKLRTSFLENVPENLAIQKAWELTAGE